MISKILIASIRARLTEVTTRGEHREQAFLKLAQDHTLNIQSLFKNASAGCTQEQHWQNGALRFHLHTTETRWGWPPLHTGETPAQLHSILGSLMEIGGFKVY